PRVIVVRAVDGAHEHAELPASRESDCHDCGHDQHHLGHQAGRNLDSRWRGKFPHCGADHESHEEIDDGPCSAEGDVQKDEGPEFIGYDRRNEGGEYYTHYRESLARDD